MSPFPAWRQELFFKSPQQLQAQIALLKDLQQSRLNITNKVHCCWTLAKPLVWPRTCKILFGI